MELCVNDRIIAHPSGDDVARAIDATPHPEGWYLILESDDALIEAGTKADGRYTVSGSDKGREIEAGTPLNAAQLKEVLLKFLAGDTTWRDAKFWTFQSA
jgi:hypothetical protein